MKSHYVPGISWHVCEKRVRWGTQRLPLGGGREKLKGGGEVQPFIGMWHMCKRVCSTRWQWECILLLTASDDVVCCCGSLELTMEVPDGPTWTHCLRLATKLPDS